MKPIIIIPNLQEALLTPPTAMGKGRRLIIENESIWRFESFRTKQKFTILVLFFSVLSVDLFTLGSGIYTFILSLSFYNKYLTIVETYPTGTYAM